MGNNYVDAIALGRLVALMRGPLSPAERSRRRAFWRRVQQRLDVLEVSHSAFGRSVGVTSGPVSEWFTRQAMPMGDVLLKFPAALRCSGHWLLTGEPPVEPVRSGSADYRAGRRAALADVAEAIREIR